MSANPWARHFQLVWEERAGDERLPLWLRVTALAYGKHRANGHAHFGRSQVRMILFSTSPETAEILPATRQAVHRAIERAMEFGLLAQGSSSMCLRVPPHAIQGGLGSPVEACTHGRHS